MLLFTVCIIPRILGSNGMERGLRLPLLRQERRFKEGKGHGIPRLFFRARASTGAGPLLASPASYAGGDGGKTAGGFERHVADGLIVPVDMKGLADQMFPA